MDTSVNYPWVPLPVSADFPGALPAGAMAGNNKIDYPSIPMPAVSGGVGVLDPGKLVIPGQTDIGQSCDWSDFSCWGKRIVSGVSDLGSSNSGTPNTGDCHFYDVGCLIKKYGGSFLAIVLGVVLIFGAIFIYARG